MHVWVNGSVLSDPTAAAVSAVDHGFTVGDGVFEAVKVVDGRPFALSRHLRRLVTSARGLGLPEPDTQAVREAVGKVLTLERLALGRLRITWTAGVQPLGSARGGGPPTLVVAAGPMERRADATSIATVPWPRNERGAVAGLKTTSYAENVVALAWARERGAEEAVFANTVGDLCEGTGSNVFYVVDGELRTPSLASGCLAGITRGLLLEWCEVKEVDEPAAVLAHADEVFLASTTRDVQPVRRCDGRDLGSAGPVTQRAAATWAAREADDVDP